jgi:hypothetical protein
LCLRETWLMVSLLTKARLIQITCIKTRDRSNGTRCETTSVCFVIRCQPCRAVSGSESDHKLLFLGELSAMSALSGKKVSHFIWNAPTDRHRGHAIPPTLCRPKKCPTKPTKPTTGLHSMGYRKRLPDKMSAVSGVTVVLERNVICLCSACAVLGLC